ncbi:TetR/AcrR family transcriptional regulator [Sporosarcina siberiensis]|uniref:TetR/AcrR family transcriptional regulator n=1 Tax=Sporosarcina siberiensis TaxID=1365606 RepID=A0ABW4SK91_9BACL
MTIYSTFDNLKTEKQELIINAALKEFVQVGFEKASTNEIVRGAKISKGSLFNYFTSKKGLYIFLIDYSIQVTEKVYEQIDYGETDIFKRIENIGVQKLHIQLEHPQVFDFLASSIQEESIEVKEIVKQKLEPIYDKGTNKMYEHIDYSKFREDVDVEKAIEILNWTMSGFGEKGIKELKGIGNIKEFGNRYLEEWMSYSELLKNSFYKK